MLHTLLDPLHPALLQPQVRHELWEGGLRHQGEVRGGVAEVLVEAGGERAEEEVVVHLGSNVTELIRQRLQAAAVVINGLFILVTVKKFLLQKNATLKLVVGEESIELVPHGASVIPITHDRVEQVLGDGGEGFYYHVGGNLGFGVNIGERLVHSWLVMNYKLVS